MLALANSAAEVMLFRSGSDPICRCGNRAQLRAMVGWASSCSMARVPQPAYSGAAIEGGAIDPRRAYMMAVWVIATSALFWVPLRAVFTYAFENDDASHIFIIPILAVALLYMDRVSVFCHVSFNIRIASVYAVVGAAIAILTRWSSAGAKSTNHLAFYMVALVILWIAGFALFFGRVALHQGRFALIFLFLSVPLPEFVLSRAIYSLQAGSASIVAVLFDAFNVPYLRSGFVFHLAHLNIEIAQECSGIRSSMAVLILALLAAHFYLRTAWKQVVFVACSLLVMIIKNGIRIAVLTILAIDVDPSFLFGRLHRDGGVVFFLLGLALLVPILWLLARGEGRELSAPAEASKT
jgi:exosortase